MDDEVIFYQCSYRVCLVRMGCNSINREYIMEVEWIDVHIKDFFISELDQLCFNENVERPFIGRVRCSIVTCKINTHGPFSLSCTISTFLLFACVDLVMEWTSECKFNLFK